MIQTNKLSAMLVKKNSEPKAPCYSTLSWQTRAALPPRQYLWEKT